MDIQNQNNSALSYGSAASNLKNDAKNYFAQQQQAEKFTGTASNALHFLGIKNPDEKLKAALFAKYDTEKGTEGKLSLNEMVQILTDADKSKDGKITADESQGFMEKLSQLAKKQQAQTAKTSEDTNTANIAQENEDSSNMASTLDSGSSSWEATRSARRGDKGSVDTAIASELDDNSNSYTVKAGDTYYDIAEALKTKYNLPQPVEELVNTLQNQVGQDAYNLQVGTNIDLKPFKPEEEAKTENVESTENNQETGETKTKLESKAIQNPQGHTFSGFLQEKGENGKSRFEDYQTRTGDLKNSMNKEEFRMAIDDFIKQYNQENPNSKIKLNDKEFGKVFQKATTLDNRLWYDANIEQADIGKKSAGELFNTLFIPATAKADAAQQPKKTEAAVATEESPNVQQLVEEQGINPDASFSISTSHAQNLFKAVDGMQAYGSDKPEEWQYFPQRNKNQPGVGFNSNYNFIAGNKNTSDGQLSKDETELARNQLAWDTHQEAGVASNDSNVNPDPINKTQAHTAREFLGNIYNTDHQGNLRLRPGLDSNGNGVFDQDDLKALAGKDGDTSNISNLDFDRATSGSNQSKKMKKTPPTDNDNITTITPEMVENAPDAKGTMPTITQEMIDAAE